MDGQTLNMHVHKYGCQKLQLSLPYPKCVKDHSLTSCMLPQLPSSLPCWGHKAVFCESGESKGKGNFENNPFFSQPDLPLFCLKEAPVHGLLVTMQTMQFLGDQEILFSPRFFLIYGEIIFLHAHNRQHRLCSEGREISASHRRAIKHLCMTSSKVVS